MLRLVRAVRAASCRTLARFRSRISDALRLARAAEDCRSEALCANIP
jgi:hypothetical protein